MIHLVSWTQRCTLQIIIITILYNCWTRVGKTSNEPKWQDDIITWKYFLHYWPFVRRIHQRWIPLTKGQRCKSWIFSLLSAWISCWVAIDLRHHVTFTVMKMRTSFSFPKWVQFLYKPLQLFSCPWTRRHLSLWPPLPPCLVHVWIEIPP